MSIASDIRTYADTAVSQGKQVLDTAQAQITGYTEAVSSSANDFVGRYTAGTRENVSDLADKTAQAVADARQTAEKAVNLDALTAAAEPYVAQLREYTSAVTDKVDELLTSARSDRRIAAVVDRVEPVVGAVVGSVVGLANERVVKPVQSFAGFGSTPAQPVRKPAPRPTRSTPAAASAPATAPRRAATTKPASKPTTKPVNKPAARKTAAKRTTD